MKFKTSKGYYKAKWLPYALAYAKVHVYKLKEINLFLFKFKYYSKVWSKGSVLPILQVEQMTPACLSYWFKDEISQYEAYTDAWSKFENKK